MCVDGLCVCPSGMQPSPQRRCEPTMSTSAPSTSSEFLLSPASTDECAAIGLYCRSNTVCRNLSCQCPVDYVLHNDGCVPTHEAGRKNSRSKARHQGTPAYARPGQKCGNGEICMAGSSCNEKGVCACPPEKPILRIDECTAHQHRRTAAPGESCDVDTICTKESTCHSGQCRCRYGHIAVSGHCVALPMPTTPVMKNVVLARPLDSCTNEEQCDGGSSCDEDTGVCMCPPGHIVFGVQCQLPPAQSTVAQPEMTPPPWSAASAASSVSPTTSALQTEFVSTDCVSNTDCHGNKICIVGRCKCRPGFVDHDDACKPLEEIELGERPVPISYAKHMVQTKSSERALEHDEFTDVASPSTRKPSRQHATQRPRIIGPPIRRPRPKAKVSSSNGGAPPGNYKSGSGAGACPPGNEPTRDDSGRILVCNGLEPNCPPRSYCYITSGGFATEEYNCCKSW